MRPLPTAAPYQGSPMNPRLCDWPCHFRAKCKVYPVRPARCRQKAVIEPSRYILPSQATELLGNVVSPALLNCCPRYDGSGFGWGECFFLASNGHKEAFWKFEAPRLAFF